MSIQIYYPPPCPHLMVGSHHGLAVGGVEEAEAVAQLVGHGLQQAGALGAGGGGLAGPGWT